MWPLDVTLAVAAALVGVVGLTQHFAPRVASTTFDQEPAVRILGVAWGVIAWMLWVTARATATGTRRLAGRAAALCFALAASVRIAGTAVLDDVTRMFPRTGEGLRALAAAGVIALLSGYVFATSPARRR